MATSFDLLKIKGADQFHLAMAKTPGTFRNYCTLVPSGTKTETLAWPGQLPIPRVMQGSRQFQNMKDFSLSLTNNTYEMSTVIPREALEDDQTGSLMQRLNDAGAAWENYKDYLFALLVSNGDVSGNTAFDGATYFNDSRTIGSSGTIDNSITSAASGGIPDGTTPDAAEIKSGIAYAKAQMWKFEDDQGRAGFAAGALSSVRLLIPPTYEMAAAEAIRSTRVPSGDVPANSSVDNVFLGQMNIGYDINPHLVEADEMVVCAVGEYRKPFVYSERTGVEIVFKNGADDIAENDGLMVLTRQRFVLTYGDPRLAVLYTWS